MPNPVHKLDREQRKWAELREQLSGADWSEDELLSALESETGLLECLSDLDESLLEDETQRDGLNATIQRLEARALRHDKAIETKRRIMLKAMERAGLKTVKGPAGTLTLGRVAPKVVILEKATIPDEYMTTPTPVPNKRKIKQALDEKKAVPGCTLDNGDVKLTIRRS